MEASTIIIGGGIVGTAIARELSKYSVKVVLIEKEADIAFGGATKANTAIIHAGYDDKPGTLTAELCQRGNALWSKLAYELNIPLRRIGSLVVALEDGETSILEELMERGKRNHVRELRIVEGKQLFETESILNRAAIAGLYAPTAGVISPYQAAIALTENAEENGVTILLGTKVTDVIVKDGEVKGVKTNKGNVYARYVINAAGLFADEVSTMAGIEGVKIVPRKGEYVVYDKGLSGLVNHVLFPVPTMMGKGIAVTPTVDGNIIAGPTANDIHDKDDRATTPLGLGEVLEDAYRLVPKLSAMRDTIITCFAGLRPQPTTDDFIIIRL